MRAVDVAAALLGAAPDVFTGANAVDKDWGTTALHVAAARGHAARGPIQ